MEALASKPTTPENKPKSWRKKRAYKPRRKKYERQDTYEARLIAAGFGREVSKLPDKSLRREPVSVLEYTLFAYDNSDMDLAVPMIRAVLSKARKG